MITSSYRNHEILSFSKDNLVIYKWSIWDIYVVFEVGWCRICLRIAEDSDPHLCLVITWYKNLNLYNCLKIKNKMCIICFRTIQQSRSERFDLTIGIVWDVTFFFFFILTKSEWNTYITEERKREKDPWYPITSSVVWITALTFKNTVEWFGNFFQISTELNHFFPPQWNFTVEWLSGALPCHCSNLCAKFWRGN